MRKAFTLIELLVVISIIALLIAILLPALGKARKAAIDLQCLSQVRSLAQATVAFSVDNKGAVPKRESNPTYNITQPHRVYRPGEFDMNRDFFSQYMPIDITGTGAASDRSGDDVLFCPGDLYASRNPETTTPANTYQYSFITYQYFPIRVDHPRLIYQKDGADFYPDYDSPDSAEANQYPLWGDLTVDIGGASYLGHDASGTVNPPSGMNAAYGDGSAAWTSWDECDTYLGYLTQEYYWSKLGS
ncbi:MAG: type II secretion system protein [Phycisphaeraceae bacterium]